MFISAYCRQDLTFASNSSHFAFERTLFQSLAFEGLLDIPRLFPLPWDIFNSYPPPISIIYICPHDYRRLFVLGQTKTGEEKHLAIVHCYSCFIFNTTWSFCVTLCFIEKHCHGLQQSYKEPRCCDASRNNVDVAITNVQDGTNVWMANL